MKTTLEKLQINNALFIRLHDKEEALMEQLRKETGLPLFNYLGNNTFSLTEKLEGSSEYHHPDGWRSYTKCVDGMTLIYYPKEDENESL